MYEKWHKIRLSAVGNSSLIAGLVASISAESPTVVDLFFAWGPDPYKPRVCVVRVCHTTHILNANNCDTCASIQSNTIDNNNN